MARCSVFVYIYIYIYIYMLGFNCDKTYKLPSSLPVNLKVIGKSQVVFGQSEEAQSGRVCWAGMQTA